MAQSFFRAASKRATPAHGDRVKSFMGVAKGHGYPVERHFYKTKDDYINCVFRIPGPLQSESVPAQKRPVMLLQHGLNDSSSLFLNEGKESIALFFAEAGYDVWLNNSRGNRYSRFHKYLDPEHDSDFWHFSFPEMGQYDQPALMEYIREQTDSDSKMTYLGHSQGCSQILMGLEKNTDFFMDRVSSFLLVGPASRNDRCTHFAPHTLFKLHEGQGLKLQNPNLFGKRFYELSAPFNFESIYMKILTEKDPSAASDLGLHNFWGHYQAGCSLQNVAHWRQILKAKKFQYFDHEDSAKNEAAYGQKTAPEVNLQAFKNAPIGLFGGLTDLVTSPPDYTWLRDELEKGGNCSYFKEYQPGHFGLLFPREKDMFYDLLAMAVEHLAPDQKESIQVPEVHQERYGVSVAEMKSKSGQS